jgi:hypothetical protein
MEVVNGLIGLCLGSVVFSLFVMVLGSNLGQILQKSFKKIF